MGLTCPIFISGCVTFGVNGVVVMFTMNSEYSIIHSVHLIVHSVYIESSFVRL